VSGAILDGVTTDGILSLSSALGSVLRNCEMNELSVAGIAMEHYIHDIDGSNLHGGLPILYAEGLAGAVNASGKGFIGLVNSTGVVLTGLAGEALALVAFSDDVTISGADVVHPGGLTARWSDVAIEDCAFSAARIAVQNCTVDAAGLLAGHLWLVGSAGTLVRVNVSSLWAYWSDFEATNLTFQGGDVDNSTIDVHSWARIKVLMTSPRWEPLEGAEVSVASDLAAEYATPGFGGSDALTGRSGNGAWFLAHVRRVTGNGTQDALTSFEVRYGGHRTEENITGLYEGVRTIAVPDEPPSMVFTSPASGAGLVTLRADVIDEEGDPVNVTLEYSADGLTWTMVPTDNQTTMLNSSAAGVSHAFMWWSTFDLPAHNGTVWLRALPSDPWNAGEAAAANITIDNTGVPHPPSVDLLMPGDGATVNSTSVTLAWQGYDRDGDELVYTLLLGPARSVPTSHPMGAATHTTVDLEDGTEYEWRVITSDGAFDAPSAQRSFAVDLNATDTAAPLIFHAPMLTALLRIPVTVTALVIDDARVGNVSLVFRSDDGAVAAPMSGGPVYTATIPAVSVSPGLWYYIEASDGTNLVTSPALGGPYNVTVTSPTDVEAPTIDHVPSAGAVWGESLAVVATISDDRYVEFAELLFIDPRYMFGHSGVEMFPVSGDRRNGTFIAVIPDYAVAPPSARYWIRATDGFSNATVGSEADPITVSVAAAERVVTARVDFSGGHADVAVAILGTGSMSASLATDPSGGKGAHVGIFIEVDVDPFDANVTWANVTIFPGDLMPGIERSRLHIHYWDAVGGQWHPAERTGPNVREGYVWANVTHLTIFAPMLEPREAGRDADMLPLVLVAGAVIAFIVLAVLFLRRRSLVDRLKARAGKPRCPRCRAELEDTMAHRCPECGALLPTKIEEDAWRDDETSGEQILKLIEGRHRKEGAEAVKGAEEEVPAEREAPPETHEPSVDFQGLGATGGKHVERYPSMRAKVPGETGPGSVDGASGPFARTGRAIARERAGGEGDDLMEGDVAGDTPEYEEAPEDAEDGGEPEDLGATPEWGGRGGRRGAGIRDIPDEGGPADGIEYEDDGAEDGTEDVAKVK
ncbi:MAG: hypothetical protein L0Z54_02285, partial [Thermoplasmata archaeon]|nr:hypothetical protein [Thermoplasmata archaeon]